MSALSPNIAAYSTYRIGQRCLYLSASLFVISTLCLFLFFFHLGDRELASSHEARAGQDAQSILLSGDWGLPRLFDGSVEMQKPPLYYWLVAFCGWFNQGQVDAWCVRLPSAFSATACVLLMWLWGLRRGRPLAGLLGTLVLATFLHFTTLARLGRIDMPLTLCVSTALIAFFEANELLRQRHGRVWPWQLIGCLAIAAGVMFKGPIALVFPLIVWAAHWMTKWWSGSESPMLALRSRILPMCWGLALILGLTLPWYLWANYQTDGEFFRVFFWQHNIDRGFGTEETLRASPWWFYGPELLRGTLPWSAVLPFILLQARRKKVSVDGDARFGLVWLLAIVVLLSLMRFKRADYLLPAYPGAAWMLGCLLERNYLATGSRRYLIGFASVVVATMGVWLGHAALIVPAVVEARTHQVFAKEIRRHAPDHVIFFRAEAHVVAFHAGPPIESFVDWEMLDARAGAEESVYVVMTVHCMDEWPQHVTRGTFELVTRSEKAGSAPLTFPGPFHWANGILDTRERPYVLIRSKRLGSADQD